MKSTTLADLSNVYLSQQQIDFMDRHRASSRLIALIFDGKGKATGEQSFSIDELRKKFEFRQ